MRIEEHTQRRFARAMRWRQSPFAGLAWFTRDSGGSLILASRHWPHMLCWSWLVRLDIRKRGSDERWWSVYRWRGNDCGSLGVRFGFGGLTLSWQTYPYPRNKADLLSFIERNGLAAAPAARTIR